MSRLIKSRAACAGLILAMAAAVSPAGAANITFFQFNADPNAGVNNVPEFVYSALSGVSAGPGAIGNGSIFSPGLLGTITGGLPGIPFSPPGLGPGPTYNLLSDLTFTLTGFTPAAVATVNPDAIVQPLTGGTFVVSYTGLASPLVLLTGTADSAILTEKDTGSNASMQAGNVAYTGGILLPYMAGAGMAPVGSFSLAMTAVIGSYSTTPVLGESHLSYFVADGAGTFDAVVPEPSGLSLLAGGGLLALRRRGKRG